MSDVTSGAAMTLFIPLSLLVVIVVVRAIEFGRHVPRRSRTDSPPDA